MHRNLETLSACFLIAALSIAAQDPRAQSSDMATHDRGVVDDERAWAARIDLEIANRLLELTLLERSGSISLPDEWQPISELIESLPAPFRGRLPKTDPWGAPYLVRQIDSDLAILSRGPDGLLDTVFPKAGTGFAARSALDVPGDDIVLVVGDRVLNGPRTAADHAKRTMADLRSIGTSVEQYSIDNDLYPAQYHGLVPTDRIAPLLSPVYIRHFPARDSWGREFLYWSDEKSYVIVSPGADGLLDQRYGTDAGSLIGVEFSGQFDDPKTDIVFSNGQFVQWPRLAQQ